jgi:hypothetical protein
MAEDDDLDFSDTGSDSSDEEDTARPFKNRNATKFAVSKEIEAVSTNGIAATVLKLNLEYITNVTGRLGNKVLAQNSKLAYEKHFKGI